MDLSNDELSWPLLKFKSTVLTVIANLSWLTDEDYFTPLTLFESRRKKTINECDEITVFHKLIFFKPPKEREQFELESVKWLFSVGFKFFKLCPTDVQLDLIKISTYKTYGPGRWIIKEGHTPENMYLIVKGCVRITKYVLDKVSKTMRLIEYCKLYEKKSFGESATIFNMNRVISVQSLSVVEMISISKNDFMDCIKNSVQITWNKNMSTIKNSSYFNKLNVMEENKCSILSVMKTYKKNDYILGKSSTDFNNGFFVVEGRVILLYNLKIVFTRNQYGNIIYELRDKIKTENRLKYHEKLMKVCTFLPNSCFNIGEKMDNKEFLALEETTLMCVPRWFMKETEKSNHWSIVAKHLTVFIPSEETVFNAFLAEIEQRHRLKRIYRQLNLYK